MNIPTKDNKNTGLQKFFSTKRSNTLIHNTDKDRLLKGKLRSLEKYIELTKQISGQDGTKI